MTVTTIKKDRSPSFPFISLRKAVERVGQFHTAHRRDSARLATVAPTWGYAIKSSGMLQTVAALKAYGLIEDSGTGDERRIKLSDLGRRILSDTRPGVREQALGEAARKPRLFAEYIERWVGEFPDDRHCVSELELDRGFTPEAAKTFVKVLKITIKYAGIDISDTPSSDHSDDSSELEQGEAVQIPAGEQQAPHPSGLPSLMSDVMGGVGNARPLAQRLRVATDGNRISVQADLVNPYEVDKLIQILQANKMLLDQGDAPPG